MGLNLVFLSFCVTLKPNFTVSLVNVYVLNYRCLCSQEQITQQSGPGGCLLEIGYDDEGERIAFLVKEDGYNIELLDPRAELMSPGSPAPLPSPMAGGGLDSPGR